MVKTEKGSFYSVMWKFGDIENKSFGRVLVLKVWLVRENENEEIGNYKNK